MLKPLSESAQELDASFSVQLTGIGFNVIFESRGGGGRLRNPDYQKAVVAVLNRMASHGMVLRDAMIASRKVSALPEAERSLLLDKFSYPLTLTGVDAQALQQCIGRALRDFGREKSASGNATKRLMLVIESSLTLDMTAFEIEAALGGRISMFEGIELWTEEPTDNLEALSARVRLVRQKMALHQKMLENPPKGVLDVKRTTTFLERFSRDPNVIAWVLENSHDYCEVCGLPAPFWRDDGRAYLEVHHVLPLSQGGPDTIDNAVAVCANCHRRLHHSADRVPLLSEVFAKIARLRDWAKTVPK